MCNCNSAQLMLVKSSDTTLSLLPETTECLHVKATKTIINEILHLKSNVDLANQ